MALYIHIGCELSGNGESNRIVDQWIHGMLLFERLEIMANVLDL